MPLYEYRCDACGHRFEVIQKFSDPPPDACVKCGKGPMERLQSSPAIQFKGTGWYITDYAQKGKSSGETSGGSAEGKGGGSGSTDTAAKTDSGTKSETTKSDTTKSGSTPAAGTAKPSGGT